jgi:SAM-dependent methyltransferase
VFSSLPAEKEVEGQPKVPEYFGNWGSTRLGCVAERLVGWNKNENDVEKQLLKKHHWNTIYQQALMQQLGWHEDDPQPSLRLIQACGLPKDARQLHAGAGASTLIDALIDDGYSNLAATDISEVALQKLKERLGPAAAGKVQWVVDDLTRPEDLPALGPVDLWNDRAVLHFFTKEEEQQAYFDLVRKLVKPEGHVVIAVFNLAGAKMCSGLPVKNYDAAMLAEKLGPEFELLEAFDHLYVMPSGGERPYVYALFKRG